VRLSRSAQRGGNPAKAVAVMREAADKEDAAEKLPVTPGPILPAREQLADLLLEQGQPEQASKEFATLLDNAPGRRRALQGAARAAEASGHKSAIR
jgi:DNA-binding SARP family transcriptional activator